MNILNKLSMIFVAIGFSLSLYAQYDYRECIDSYGNGDYAEAIVCFSKYIDKNPKDVDAFTLRALCYEQVEDYVRALSDINEAIKNHNKTAISEIDVLYARRGILYANIENYDEALKNYATALKINPKNTDILFNRANLYYGLENYSASDADWKQVLNIDKDNINASIGIARNMIGRGQIENAIKELDRLEKIDFRNPLIYEYRSKAYAQNKDYRKAIDDVIEWMYYDEIDSYNELALLYYAEYEPVYVLAKVSKQVVTANEEDKIYWLFLRASLYEEREMYKEAIADYNMVENLSSSPQISCYIRSGRCYNEIGEYDKAIDQLNKGLELQEHKNLYRHKANAERLKGDYEASIADYTKVIELDPMSNFAYYMRGWVKEFKNDFQDALNDYTIAIEIDNDYAYTYVARGRLYQRELNQQELAEKDFQTVLRLEKNIQKSGNCRQYALFHLGKINEAIGLQDSILSKYPTSGNHYDAACLYSLMNRPSEAIAYLRTSFEKGFRDFIHIEHDRDMDNIRNIPEFIELVKEWKDKTEKISAETTRGAGQIEIKRYVVKTKPLKSGVYEIPCTVNDLPLKFIFDTGAASITISSLDAAFMLKNKYLNEYDFRDRRNYRTASGDIVEGSVIRLRKIKIGDLELDNIEASVVHKQNAPLLFGQSALGKFVKIIIDNANNEIIFEK